MKKTGTIISVFLLMSGLDAQVGKVSLPQILPPSPEAASLARGGQLSVGLFTGAPSASIPLYEIKLRNLSVPVSLTYSSNGFKVDEIPGRTGLGWNLSLGGSVNRIVHGKPDDESDFMAHPSANATATQLDNYYDSVTSSIIDKDSQPDEFTLSAPGISARFYLDENNEPVFFPHSNLKIQILGGTGQTNPFSVFVVTATDGTVYRFGGAGAIETTITHNMAGNSIYRQQVRTAFFLKSIRLPEGDSLVYSYSPIRFSTFPGISQGVRKGIVENLNQGCTCNDVTKCPGPYVDPASFNETVSEVMYSSVYLREIKGPNGLWIRITYESRPDGSGDNRINAIQIQAPYMARLFRLLYSDPGTVGNSGGNHSSDGNYNKRFFLTEVQSVKRQQGSIPADTIKYTLDYDDINNLPPRLSFSQDVLGFYNGINNAYFLPIEAGQSQYWGVYASADRSFRGASAVKGMLTKITYPTGGFDQFEYEPNTVSKLESQSGQNAVMITKSISGSGNSTPSTPSGTWDSVHHYTDTLLVLKDQNATVTIHTFKNPGCEACNQAPPNTVDWAWLRIINVTTNTVVWTELLRTDTTLTFQIPVYTNNIYKLKLTVRGLPNAGYAEILYDRSPTGYNGGTTFRNVEAGGVRVKQINTYDPVSQMIYHKNYRYASRATPATSSGKSLFTPEYLESFDYREDCSHGGTANCIPPQGPPAGDHVSCSFYVLSSNSAMPLYLFDNNHIAYEYVCESEDTINSNGSIEHKFDVSVYYNRTVNRGNEITSLPVNTIVKATGSEISTGVYNAAGTLLKETYNYFSTHPGFLKEFKAYGVRRRYSLGMFDDRVIADTLHPWDETRFDYQAYWVQLDSTVSYEYGSGASLKTKTTQFYGSAVNTLPAKTETISSKGEISSVEFYYPTDFPGSFPYDSMIAKNQISPVVEQAEKNVTLNRELARVKTYYGRLSGNLFRPDSIQRSFSGGNLMTEVVFNLYDSSGNLRQMTAKNGLITSYIWGYNRLYPVAQIVGRGYYDAVSASGINVNNLSGIPVDTSGQSELDLLRTLNNALVTTSLYRPYTGVSIQTDPRGKSIYYYYDNTGRLTMVKDQDGRVIRKICYTYAGRTEYCSTGCSNISSGWQNTQTALRCQTDSIGRYTGYQEQEQMDTVICSPTYGLTRWVLSGYHPETCQVTDSIAVHSINYIAQGGYYAVFVNNASGEVKSYAIPTATGSQTLGTLPAGNYSVVMYKPGGGTLALVFGACGQTISAVSATFSSVNITSGCHTVTLDAQ